MERAALWILILTLFGIGVWRHVVLTEALLQEQRDRDAGIMELRALHDTLSKKSQSDADRLKSSIDALSKQAEATSALSTKSQNVLELLYVIRYGPDGKPDAIAPRNEDAGIGLRQ